jgi:hypothetical protein
MSASEKRRPEDAGDMPLASAESLLKELASLSLPFGARLEQGPGGGAKRPDVEARYQTLVEQMPAVIFMAFLGDSGCEAYVSPKIEAALGFHTGRMVERSRALVLANTSRRPGALEC